MTLSETTNDTLFQCAYTPRMKRVTDLGEEVVDHAVFAGVDVVVHLEQSLEEQ